MRVLVACEFSGIVRDAFAARGHDAWSCDLEPTERPGKHYQQDVRDIGSRGWDLIIAHPPCRYLAVSGARWWSQRRTEQAEALEFVRYFMALGERGIPTAIENPVGCISTRLRPPDQIIQPWQFSHGETKATCLWLYGLPKLKPTDIVPGREPRIHHMPPSAQRARERSRTYPGIARAMAEQWSDYVIIPHPDNL